jgi:hypothetical protein
VKVKGERCHFPVSVSNCVLVTGNTSTVVTFSSEAVREVSSFGRRVYLEPSGAGGWGGVVLHGTPEVMA